MVEPVACGACGVPAPPADSEQLASTEPSASDVRPPPLTWSREVERGIVTWLCAACARTHVRAIEGRLDREWW